MLVCTYASLCSNGHPAIQAKYTYSTLLPAFPFGCVVYASATTPCTFIPLAVERLTPCKLYVHPTVEIPKWLRPARPFHSVDCGKGPTPCTSILMLIIPEPVFLKVYGAPESIPRLAEFIPWLQFRGLINIEKYGLDDADTNSDFLPDADHMMRIWI